MKSGASSRAGVAYGLCAALSWALHNVGTRFGLGQGFDTWDLTALRFAVAGLVLLPVLWRAPRSLGGVGWRRGLVLTICAGPAFSLLLAGGLALTPIAHAATINPVVITLGSLGLAALFLRDRPGPAALAGVALVLAGLVMVTGFGGGGAAPAGRAPSPLGDLLLLCSGLLWASYTVSLRRWSVPPVAATAAVSVLSLLAMVPAYLMARGTDRLLADPGATALQALVQGGFAGVAGVLTYSLAVRHLGAGRAGVFPSLVPTVVVLLGVPLLGEWPTATQAAGVAAATLGLVLAVAAPSLRLGFRPAVLAPRKCPQ